MITLLPRRTKIFLKQPVVTWEGAHICYDQLLLPDFAETVLFWLYCCCSLPLLLKTEAWLDNVVGYRLRLKSNFCFGHLYNLALGSI